MQKSLRITFENSLLDTLTKQGYVIRPRGRWGLEVWGTNLVDHFVLTYDVTLMDLVDIVYLDPKHQQHVS